MVDRVQAIHDTQKDSSESLQDSIQSLAVNQRMLSQTLEGRYTDITRGIQTTYDVQVQSSASLHTSLERMSVSQSTASVIILDKMDNIMTQNQALHDSQTKSNSTLQKFLDMSVHPIGASIGQTSTALGHGSVSPGESITRNGMLASRRITTEDPEIIGKIIQAELRQQLEPLSGSIEGMKELVNSVALTVS